MRKVVCVQKHSSMRPLCLHIWKLQNMTTGWYGCFWYSLCSATHGTWCAFRLSLKHLCSNVMHLQTLQPCQTAYSPWSPFLRNLWLSRLILWVLTLFLAAHEWKQCAMIYPLCTVFTMYFVFVLKLWPHKNPSTCSAHPWVLSVHKATSSSP